MSQAWLQYVDKFKITKDTPQLNNLFNTQNRYISHHLFENHDVWHIHQGWFEKPGEQAKILHNLNIEVLEEIGTDQAQLINVISHKMDGS
ncbi:MAG: hypothetical protein ABW189_07500 [Rickettsiales bacterium]